MKTNKMRIFVRCLTAICILFLSVCFQACKKNDTQPTTPPVVKAPVITDFNPKKGQVGATIIITGTNFDSTSALNNGVKFNGVAATVTHATSTQLTVTVPTGASKGRITATVNSLTDTSATAFDVRGPLKLSNVHGITNQLIYLTGEIVSEPLRTAIALLFMGAGSGILVSYWDIIPIRWCCWCPI